MRIVSLLLTSLIVSGVVSIVRLSGHVDATSGYDDIVEKVTISKLVNSVDNYYGKSCGSPGSDYTLRWLHLFKRQMSNNRDYHSEAIKSLERAISSHDGAYAVVYEQKNNHDNTSNPYFIKVYWVEDRDKFRARFYGEASWRRLRIERGSGLGVIYHAVVASPKLIQGGVVWLRA